MNSGCAVMPQAPKGEFVAAKVELEYNLFESFE